MKHIFRILGLLIGLYVAAYGFAYTMRTRQFCRKGTAPAYWAYTSNPKAKFERIIYAAFFPAYELHKMILGVPELHLLDPADYPQADPSATIIE